MKLNLRSFLLLLSVFAFSIQLQAQTQSPQKALSFNGSTQYVSGTTGISTSLTAITIEAWVYHNTLPASVVQRYVTINPEVAVLRYDGSGGVNKLHFYIKKTNGSLYALQAENVLTTGTWMHVAGTYDGTTMKLYLNGKLLSSATPAGGLYPPSGSFSFSANGAEAFNGKMDEVSVWNSARTITDIREDMYRTAPTANANLKNYWQFNDGSGTTLSDMKGTATGTLQNTPTWVASTIPFAAGAVNTQIVTATGTKTFTGTGLVMNFTAKSGTDTIVTSRIDTLSNVSPTGVTTAFNSQYWVINRFGTGTFTTNATFTVSEDITSGQVAHPSLVQLYKRSGNGDGSWSLVATAASADAVNNTATFNGITSFDGQYMVCFSSPPNTVGTALNFDGTNDYVDCGNASSLNITGAITIEAWINADTWNANSWGGTIVGKDNTSSSGFDLRCGNGGMLSFVVGVGGAWHEVLSGAVMSSGRWNYVAGVYDGSTLSIYVNGVLAGQQSLSGSIGVSALSLFIGNSPGFPTRVFDGKIDEVRLFNVARTQAQIQSDMCNTLTGTETGLVNYWQFNNGSGTTLTDVVASSNGTLTNIDAATCWVESYAMVVPAPAAATSITFTGFTANWTAPAIGTVTSYKLDVSTNTTFTAMVSGYNNVDCGNNLSKAVTGLTSGVTYYYRVRADKTSLTGTGANYYTYTTVTTSCTPPTITSQSTASQTQPEYCSFYPITVTATGTDLTYQWYSNTVASNSGGTSLGADDFGSQTSSYTPQGKAAGTLYYYCVVSGCGISQTSAVSGAFISTAVAAPAGSGTVADPYRIASLDNLCWLQAPANKAYWTSNFIQTADINAAPCKNWNGGTGFSPIGYYDGSTYYKFSGTYKGKGHTVDSIYIDGTTRSSVQGFFGYIINATIDSLSVTNVSILSRGYVGGLVGVAEAESNTTTTISYCSSSGTVTGLSNNNSRYGGLVGEVNNYNYTNGSNVLIKYCYSSAKVSSGPSYYQNLGGFAGLQSGHITQCYSRGLVVTDNYLIGNAGGGFVGYFNTQSGTIDSSYWDIETSGQTTGGKYTDTTQVHGRTTAQMKTQSTYTGWDFSNRWYISANANNGYPCFYYAPELSTQAVSNIQNFTASAHGTIVCKGTPIISSYGVCYNTTGTPTIADAKVNLGATSGFGAFTANMSGLHHGTTYYMRAYAINERDTVYGEQQSFTTTNVTQASTCLYNGDQANYISVPNSSSLQLTNNYSIEVWIKPGVAVTTNRIIVSKGYNANGYTLLSSGSGNHRGLIFDGMATADNILTQNQWCHIAAVNNNGTRHLYVNGEEVALTGTPTSVTANTQPLYLSNYDNGGSSNCFRGYIEEVRLWNTAMTYAQIRENMHLPLTGSETGLVSYWQFDEGQPPIVYDKKGVNNGTWYASAINQYINSSIPFGSGYSNTQVVSTTGTTTFTNTGLAINFTTKSGSDIIVVARIDSFPNINPTEVDAVFDRQYWAVHKYGPGDYTANLTFTITENFTASDELQPGKIDLYTRTSATDDNWTYLASASSVSATNHQVTFNGLNNIMNPSENDPNSVKYLGQYIIVREQCQVNIPDVNFKTALLAIPGLDANSDGKIQCTEATAFTGDIDVNAKTIADMTGIEAFTHITKLYCSHNNFTSLNISALTLLTDLDCSYNQLTALSITSNTALKNFSCANNSLTSLNVSGNASLNYLLCRYNQLASLDVTSNSALIGLFCNNNILTSLNVTGLTSLTNINCGVNQLTNLDFSTNTGITNLGCDYNSLTSLNVKNGHNTIMSGSNFYATNNPGLSCIKVDDVAWSTTNWIHKDAGASYSTDCIPPCIVNIPDANFKAALLAISGLDANNDGEIQCSEATAWTDTIDVYSQNISDLTGIEAFTNLTHLDCGANSISSLDVSSNTALVNFYCGGNDLSTLDLTANTALVKVNCIYNLLIGLNISGLTSLTELDCHNNQLASLDVSTNTSLNRLGCTDNVLTNLNISGLTSLKNIYCYSNQLTTLDISLNTTLEALYCNDNSLTTLNMKNGNNVNMGNHLDATNNPGLSCIQVDDVAWSTANWTNVDAGVSYSTNCACTNPAISSQSTATQTQCLDGTFTPITVTATGTNLIYQWYSNATASTSGGTTIGTNSNSYTPLATTVGTLYYYCEVSGDCGIPQSTAVSGAFIVNTIPDTPSNTTPLANQTINSGHSTILSASGTGTLGWYSASTGNEWLGGGVNYTTPALTTNTTYYVQDSTICGVSATRTAIAVEVVCIVNIPDTNFKTALLAIAGLDANSDGEIQCSEATAYTGTINVDAKGIADLSGIESFTSIANLICSNNSLNALNLSSNSLLTYLDCSFNQLTSLDVSSNTHLTNLQCGYNSLTSLNVSSLTSLNELACNANQLTNLNLSSNTALTKLECSSNALTSLNVSGLTLLVDLYCFNNQLTNLYVLANASIGILECDQNLLTSLDVTGLTSLYYVTCYNNQLTTLDFSSNTSLRGLYCNDNLLTSLNVKNGNNTNFPYFDFDATYNPGLSCIQVDNAAYSTANWTQIDAGASFSTNCTPPCIVNIPDANFKAQLLADVTINTNNDGEIQCSEATAFTGVIHAYTEGENVADMTGIEAFTNATELYCGGNTFTTINLSSNTALQRLYCNDNDLSTLDLSSNTALEYLDCNSSSLTSINVTGLTSLTYIDCSYNQLTGLDVSTNTALLTLNCKDNSLTSLNVSGFTALTSINCSYNQLTGLDVSTNSALQTLNCYTNSLTSLNVLGLNNLIEINVGHNQLSTLNLSGLTSLNKIVVYYNQLASINLNGFTSLAYIDCSSNQFSNLNFSGIGLTSLTEIYCNSNLLTSLNVSGLTTLNEIDCYNNQLTNLDFSSNTAIQYLYCMNNLLTSLNVKNGYNTIMSDFRATNNPNLSCIQVDDAAYSTANWTNIDAGAGYSTNCAPTTRTLNLKLFLEGLYAGNGLMNEAMDGNTGAPQWGDGIADKIQVDLYEENAPYAPIGVSISGINLADSGFASFNVAQTLNGNYFIKVSNRNHLQTWSAIAIPFNTNPVVYDFTSDMMQAYGTDAQVMIAPNIYAFYLGDLDQGGWVDADDFNLFEPDLTMGATGFYISDFNGSGWVDADDFNLFEPRLTMGVAAQYPAKKK